MSNLTQKFYDWLFHDKELGDVKAPNWKIALRLTFTVALPLYLFFLFIATLLG